MCMMPRPTVSSQEPDSNWQSQLLEAYYAGAVTDLEYRELAQEGLLYFDFATGEDQDFQVIAELMVTE